MKQQDNRDYTIAIHTLLIIYLVEYVLYGNVDYIIHDGGVVMAC